MVRAGHNVSCASLKAYITHLSAYYATSSFPSFNLAMIRSDTSHAKRTRSKDTHVTILSYRKSSKYHILDKTPPASTDACTFGGRRYQY